MRTPEVEDAAAPWSALWLPAVLAAALAALLHLPFLGAMELDDEEGRRAWPAREMLESDQWTVPTIYGEPYLAKPPLYFWSIAGTAAVLNRPVDEWTTRLPAALSTIVTAFAVTIVAGRLAGRRAAFCAGLAFPVTFGVLEKGAFGELEAALGCATFLATATVVCGRSHTGARSVSSGACGALGLGAALLIKGPPALLFLVASLVGARLAGDAPRALRRPGPWIALVGGLAVALAWVLALRADPRGAAALATWTEETVGRGERGFVGIVRERVEFLVGFASQAFPAGWLAVAAFFGAARPRSAAWRAALWTIAIALALLLIAPGTRPRYAYPLLPWCAVAAGLALDSRLASPGRSTRALWTVVGPTVVVGLALAAAGSVAALRPIEGIGPLAPHGVVLVAAGGAAAVLAARALGRGAVALALAAGLAVLTSLRLVERTEVVRQTAERLERRADGAALAALVPEGERLHVLRWSLFNTLFYVPRDVAYERDPSALPAGAWVVAPGPLPEGFEAVGAVRNHEGDEVTVGRATR